MLNLVASSFPFLSLLLTVAVADVVLTGNNLTLSFNDFEAKFARSIGEHGECGVLYMADPVDACSPLTKKLAHADDAGASRFLLIARGGCCFEDKVRRAQTAGYKAAIVYDTEDDGFLIAREQGRSCLLEGIRRSFPWSDIVAHVSGNSTGIKIHALSVTKAAGVALTKYAGLSNMELRIFPSVENSVWLIMVISFISLLVMAAMLASCLFFHKPHMRQPLFHGIRDFRAMSARRVKALPSLIFTSVLEGNHCNGTSMTCAICLEEYSVGEKLRILPCHHRFHACCVDSWLATRRRFCPVCKHDAKAHPSKPPASEQTPLLSSSPALPSIRSSCASSSALPICHQSQSPSICESLIDIRNGSSQGSHDSFITMPSPESVLSGCMGSSIQQQPPLCHSKSVASSFSSVESSASC